MSELVAILDCGHTTNGTDGDGNPVCVIDDSRIIAVEVDLSERLARCGYISCGRTAPSSRGLAFFEYKGPGSKSAIESCGNCGSHQVAHQEINPSTKRPGHKHGVCEFTPKGDAGYDEYYCGCRGWD
jgi:hypothetical protein